MKLVFTGIQGCGKGTQARLLQEKYGFEIVEMGGELRKVIASGSELGLKLKKTMDAGYLVGDEDGSAVMKAAIEEYKSHEKVIFDAFIRLDWNKQVFDSYLSDYTVVFFNLSEEKAKKRLLGRMYNPKTGETFPSGTETDPKNGDELIQRKDDNEESILKRIEEYVKNTLPIVEAQKQEGRVIELNADQAILDVFAELEKKLGFAEEKDSCLMNNE
ncbi:nucleoside monophosphate kinase [Candidatus Gracilibacteria bacterium]|nr:nucleoside monophosphate kinase [Candidatus Gracilibacteria bacterium]